MCFDVAWVLFSCGWGIDSFVGFVLDGACLARCWLWCTCARLADWRFWLFRMWFALLGFGFLIWFSSTIAVFGLLAGVVGSEWVWWFWLMLGVGGCGVWWLSVGLWRSFYGRVACGLGLGECC